MVAGRHGAGSMTEREPGVWRLRVYTGRDGAGRPLQNHQTFRGGERAAAKELAKLVSKVESGQFERTRATVGDLLDKWLEHIEDKRRRIGNRPRRY